MMRPIEVGPENQLIKNKILKTNELSNQYSRLYLSSTASKLTISLMQFS